MKQPAPVVALLLLTLVPQIGASSAHASPLESGQVEAATAADTPTVTAAGDDVLALPIPELVEALRSGSVSAEALVRGYLARIEAIDRSGPTLQSVLATNPEAIAAAQASDARRAAGETLGPLDGIPILLKDNIESADPMPTTAGALALAENVTGRDAPLVAGLRAQGAIILGKTNLSQWANIRSSHSISGWSALGGQVRNPHMLDRSPCGSSSGSGAAVAASLAAGAVGTETNGSIICPATVNGVVGFKPTVGLVSQERIVPISFSQDTAGPMTRTVAGAALLLQAMSTPAAEGEAAPDFFAGLDPKALAGARIGVARFAQGSNPDITALFDRAIEDLAAAGAVVVEIAEHETPDGFWGAARQVLGYELKDGLDAYLSDLPEAVTSRDLAAVIAFNREHADVELALFGQDIFESSAELGGLDSAEYIAARDLVQNATRKDGIDALLAKHEVVAIVSPSGPLAPRVDPINGDVWPDWAGAGWMAAIAGFPHLSVPMGTVDGLPVGISFLGAANQDGLMLSLGHAYELQSRRRVEPAFLTDAEARPDIARAMRGVR